MNNLSSVKMVNYSLMLLIIIEYLVILYDIIENKKKRFIF